MLKKETAVKMPSPNVDNEFDPSLYLGIHRREWSDS